MLVVYICAALYKISTGTPASRGPSATAGLLVLVASTLFAMLFLKAVRYENLTVNGSAFQTFITLIALMSTCINGSTKFNEITPGGIY